MNETKVNTNIGDVASPETKNMSLPPQYVGRIDTPHGAQYVDRGAALDHAYMRSKQLSSLLLLMSGEGLDYFSRLNNNARDSLLWLARQLATDHVRHRHCRPGRRCGMSSRKPVSMLEDEYGLFEDRTINAGNALLPGTNSAGLLMRDMNRMYQIVAGLGVVMRIVTGNAVLESEFDPSEPDESAPPLSKAAEGMLTAMAAAMCEEIRDKMERRANEFNREVKA